MKYLGKNLTTTALFDSYNLIFTTYNNLRLFDVLSNFNKSERSAIISNKHVAYELPRELPNDLRVRILGN